MSECVAAVGTRYLKECEVGVDQGARFKTEQPFQAKASWEQSSFYNSCWISILILVMIKLLSTSTYVYVYEDLPEQYTP